MHGKGGFRVYRIMAREKHVEKLMDKYLNLLKINLTLVTFMLPEVNHDN